MACWFRDWYSQYYDDHIADEQARAARLAEAAERAARLAIENARAGLRR